MHDEHDTSNERALFDALPRESEVPPGEEERLVRRLRGEGFFHSPSRLSWRVALGAAAALVAGVLIGWYAAGARSLEGQLTRDQLTVAEAATLFDRAREAYTRARDRYVAASGGESPAQEPSSVDRPGAAPVRTAGVLWF